MKEDTTFEKIKKYTKQLYEVAKYSPNIRKCAEIAVNEYIKPTELSMFCSIFGVTKREYIDRIVYEVENTK
jgi:hypothetical protein